MLRLIETSRVGCFLYDESGATRLDFALALVFTLLALIASLGLTTHATDGSLLHMADRVVAGN